MTPILTVLRSETPSEQQLNHTYKEDDNINPEPIVSPIDLGNVSISVYGNEYDWKDYSNRRKPIKGLKGYVDKIFIPICSTFSGKISNHYDFIKVEDYIEGIHFLSGLETEGLIVPAGTGVLVCTADCPTIVIVNKLTGQIIVAHAGLRSLIDVPKILTGVPSRENESVINDIMERTGNVDQLDIYVVCGIHFNDFIYSTSDQIHKENNIKIINYLLNEYGYQTVPLGVGHDGIDLNAIIETQFQEYGIKESQIHFDGLNTFNDPRLWSHRRSFLNGEPEGRNGILVIHKK